MNDLGVILGLLGSGIILILSFIAIQKIRSIAAKVIEEARDVVELIESNKKINPLFDASENLISISDTEFVLKKPWHKYFAEKFNSNIASSSATKIISSLTGVGLVFTFLLLAFSVREIGLAIQSENKPDSQDSSISSVIDVKVNPPQDSDGNSKKQNVDKTQELLGDAFQKMQSKFIVSMTGLLMSLALIGFTQFYRNKKMNILRDMFNRISDHTPLRLSYEMRYLRDSTHQLQYLTKLDNLEVNLTQLSGELLTRISNSFSAAIGEKIVLIAEQQRTSLESIKTSLVTAVQEAMNVNSKATAEALRDSMKQIADKIDAKSNNNVEALVDKIQDMLSGGTRNHTIEMGTAIRTFNSSIESMQAVVHELSSSLQNITSSATQQSSIQASFIQNEIPRVFSKLDQVVSGIEAQNRQTVTSLQELLSSNHSNNLSNFENIKNTFQNSEQRIADSSVAASENISNVSLRAAESLALASQQAGRHLAEISARSTEQLAQKNQELSTSVESQIQLASEQARVLLENYREIQSAQQSLIQTIANTVAQVGNAQGDASRMQMQLTSAVGELRTLNGVVDRTSETLSRIPVVVEQTSHTVNDLLQRQQTNIQSINQALEAKNRTWDESTELFTRKYKIASEQIEQSYHNLVQQFSRATDLSQNISDLADNVSSLRDTVAKQKNNA